MMREMDELEKCMWFLAGTGWVHTEAGWGDGYGRVHEFESPSDSQGDVLVRVRYENRKSRIEWTDCGTRSIFEVDGMLTGVVHGYMLASSLGTMFVPRRIKGHIHRSSFRITDLSVKGDEMAGNVLLHIGQVCCGLEKVKNIVGIDMIERRHGFLWIVDWQEPDDGEA